MFIVKLLSIVCYLSERSTDIIKPQHRWQPNAIYCVHSFTFTCAQRILFSAGIKLCAVLVSAKRNSSIAQIYPYPTRITTLLVVLQDIPNKINANEQTDIITNCRPIYSCNDTLCVLRIWPSLLRNICLPNCYVVHVALLSCGIPGFCELSLYLFVFCGNFLADSPKINVIPLFCSLSSQLLHLLSVLFDFFLFLFVHCWVFLCTSFILFSVFILSMLLVSILSNGFMFCWSTWQFATAVNIPLYGSSWLTI